MMKAVVFRRSATSGTDLHMIRGTKAADNRAHCGYCETATVASVASVALALPEAVRAASRLLSRRVGHAIH